MKARARPEPRDQGQAAPLMVVMLLVSTLINHVVGERVRTVRSG